MTFTNQSTGGTFYQWSFGDGGVSVDENPTHTYTADGTYTVTLVVINDCGTDTFMIDVDVQGTAIGPDGLGGAISVFPNPASDVVFVEITNLNSDELNISIISALGQEMLTKTLTNVFGTVNEKVDVSQLPAGNYIVRFTDADGATMHQHIIKE